jgi:lysine-specific demethylase/histidyl-hydroxylase NO66
LARPGIARLVLEDDKAVVYHCADNSRVFRGNPLSPLEFDMDDGPALEQLITTVEPAWIMVNDLLHDSIEDKVAIAGSLYDDGILQILNPDEADE